MFERFTDRARKVMKLAKPESHRFNHDYIGTEHILLGLLRVKNAAAVKVMEDLGVHPSKVRMELVDLLEL